MTSDMGGLYRIAEAIGSLRSVPEELAQNERQLALTEERIELDRRALALNYAKDIREIDFRTDKEPNPAPQHERILVAARAYYAFLADGPDGKQDR